MIVVTRVTALRARRVRVTVSLCVVASFGGCQFDSSPLPGVSRAPPPGNTEHNTARGALDAMRPPSRSDASQTSRPAQLLPAVVSMRPAPASGPNLESEGGDGGEILNAASPAGAVPDASVDAGTDAAPAGDASHPSHDAGRPATVPGSVFGACGLNADCHSGLVCTGDPTTGRTATRSGYCTALCDPAGVLGMPCPQPLDGMVRTTCAGALCLLGSCERSACPSSMHCLQTMTQGVPGQVAYAFDCVP